MQIYMSDYLNHIIFSCFHPQLRWHMLDMNVIFNMHTVILSFAANPNAENERKNEIGVSGVVGLSARISHLIWPLLDNPLHRKAEPAPDYLSILQSSSAYTSTRLIQSNKCVGLIAQIASYRMSRQLFQALFLSC